jgi:hypothetical protein
MLKTEFPMTQNDQEKKMPPSNMGKKFARSALQIAGATPGVGGIFSAIAGAWSEREQEQVNRFFEHWIQMLQDELKEKEETMIEILARLDMTDEDTKNRIESPQYRSLLRKAFREWAGAESEDKRQYIRNILSNAAGTMLASDDVIRLFLDWLKFYSELHFKVIGKIYNNKGITRGGVWKALGKSPAREDSADADLYKLLFRDLSMGGIVRQYRKTTSDGSFIKKKNSGRRNSSSTTMKSAFDEADAYELTELGQQFVHYAMNELTLRIDFRKNHEGPPIDI